MKHRHALLALVALVGLGWLAVPGEAVEPQAGKIAAAAFEVKMRILEGVREGAPAPAKPVTASFLKFLEFSNYESEEDIAVEQQLRTAFNLKDARLLTEARLAWEKGKTERAFHMFRLNGHEYLVVVTPGRLAAPNQYRIEVFEQSGDKKTSLLDTEFSLPHTNAAVFGFEDSQLKPYFIFLRGVRWSGETAPTPGAVRGPVAAAAPGKPGIKPPKLVREVKPVYPEEASKAGLEGVVIIEATTDTYGRVAEAKVLRGVPGLNQAALDAVKQWVYEPMVIDGVPKPVVFTVTVQFKADKKEKPQGVAVGVEGGVAGGVVGGVEGGVVGGVVGGLEGGVGAKDPKKFQEDAVRAVGDIKPPEIVKMVKPVYPDVARQARVDGVVILEAKTDEQGKVVDARVLRSIPLLDKAAVDAVRQWKYEPLIIAGKPRKALFTVTVRFQIDEGRMEKAAEKFAEGAVKIEKDVRPPRFVKHVPPVYPEIAKAAGVEGTVILSVRTGPDGKVENIMVLRSVPLLDQAAIDAVRQWVYESVVVDGKAVPAVFTQTVRFQLK
jgi:TonB family protein